jgi:hypothetical protein
MLWETLKVGDLVLLITLPSVFHSPNCNINENTALVYKKILAQNKPLKVKKIENGIPFVQFREKRRGKIFCHSIAFNHDNFKLIQK